MKSYWFLILLLISLSAPLGASSPHPFDEISHNQNYQRQLKEVLRQAVAHNFGLEGTLPASLAPPFQKPVGLFVTAHKNGRVLGCMGTLQAIQANLAEEIFFNLQKAFSQDPRHSPIPQSEVEGIEIVLTAVGGKERVKQLNSINPTRDSILLRRGNKEGVVLAGEAKTLRYMLALAKAKAGIKKDEPFQVYRLNTKLIKVSLD